MIPSVQDILSGLLSGSFTVAEAQNWIDQHIAISYETNDLRDHFAGLAMQAAATNPKGADGFTFDERAVWAYQQADAMLKAREA